jgi:uncharacterized LabA/DUF88 family protein
MGIRRVIAFIDGFNLYHAIDGQNAHEPSDHLKWLDLRALSEIYAPASDYSLVGIKYFSAFATWLPDAHKRHRSFVRALESVGVDVIMGSFKEKDRRCIRCGNRWRAHEEKETDVNIAIHILNDAYQDRCDMALICTADSDLSPAIRMLRAETTKAVRILFPIGLGSDELAAAAGGGSSVRRMKRIHLERSLLPREVKSQTGHTKAVRPAKYDPPTRGR